MCTLPISSVGVIKPREEKMLIDVVVNGYNNGISTATQALKKVSAEDNTGALKA